MNKLKVVKKCRVCLEEKLFCKPLFENVLQEYLPSLIESICGVQILQEEEPHSVICIECAMALIQAETIKQKFLSSQEILLKERENPKEEDTEELDMNEFIKWVGNSDKANTFDDAADELPSNIIFPYTRSQRKKKKKRKPFNRPTPYHFCCDMCSFESDYAKNFRNHMMEVHEVEKPYIFKCDHCSEKYRSYLSLQSHLARHHESENHRFNFLCSECGKSFFTQSRLQRHSYTHNPEERPYKCEVCSKLFGTHSNMRRHKETHHSEAYPFTCEICEKTFAAISFLETHQRRVHTFTEF